MRRALKHLYLPVVVFLLAVAIIPACAQSSAPTPAPAKQETPATKPTPQPTATAESKSAATPEAKPPTKETTVKYGDLHILSDGPVYIAYRKGYFKEQGINIEFEGFDSAARMIPALSSGQLDAGGGASSAGLFNAMARNIGLRIVADKGSIGKGHSGTVLAIRKDLVDSGKFKDYSDLKGKTIAISAKASANHINVAKALEKGNLRLDDVNIVEMNFADQMTAFANKSIDAAIQIEPTATLGEDKGLFVIWKRVYDIQPGQQTGVLIYSDAFVKRDPDAANRFMVAFIKGARDYTDAFDKKTKKALDEVVPIMMESTSVKDASLYQRMQSGWVDPNGKIGIQSLQDDLEWYFQHGYVKERPDLKVGVDTSFGENAVKVLGVYK